MAERQTFRAVCDEIAAGFQRHDIGVRNSVTGRTIPNADGEYRGEDIFNWSSRGELSHIWEWRAIVAELDATTHP